MIRPADGLIPGGSTVLVWIAPDGTVLHLAGGLLAGTEGFELGAGADKLGHVDGSDEWDVSPDGVGERWLGVVFGHGTVDLPIRVSGDTAEQFARRRDWLRELMPRDRSGWLAAFGNGFGWRFLQCRRGSLAPAYTRDPAGTNSAVFDVLLLADNPFSRAADHVPAPWVNTTGAATVSGALRLYPGREVAGWPRFVFDGPGILHLSYPGNDITFPEVHAGEQVQIDTRNGAQILRARRLDKPGPGRNLWPLMKGQQFGAPLAPGEVTTIRFDITKASPATRLAASVRQYQEGLM